jgi:adenylate cyclase
VTGVQRYELAERAGVPQSFVERLVELKILVPSDDGTFSGGDLNRTRLMWSTEQAGVPLDGVAKAMEAGRFTLAFLDMPHYRWSPISDRTFGQVAEESGIALEHLLNAEEAQGSERPGPADRVRQDVIDMIPIIRMSLDAGIDPGIFPRLTRIYADSMRRIAEAEGYVFHNYLELPMLRSGLGPKEMAEMANAFGAQITHLQEGLILGMYRRQQELVWTADTIEHMESALEEMGLHERLARPPAMVFLDLTGYTRLTEERGDRAAADLAGQLGDLVQRGARTHGGRPVKWLGDGVMCYFGEPTGAVAAALALVEDVPKSGLPPAHVGVAAGPVIAQDGDYFGRTVNLAARLAGHARAGQTLVEEDVVRLTGRSGLRFEDRGTVELKGIPHPVRVHEAFRDDLDSAGG